MVARDIGGGGGAGALDGGNFCRWKPICQVLAVTIGAGGLVAWIVVKMMARVRNGIDTVVAFPAATVTAPGGGRGGHPGSHPGGAGGSGGGARGNRDPSVR